MAGFLASCLAGFPFALAGMTDAKTPPRENLLLNLACNVAAPTIILLKFSKAEHLGPKWGLIFALCFPLGYGIYDLLRRRSFNVLTGLGFASTLVTGGLGLLQLQPIWFAVKEAAVPSLIGLTVLISQWCKRPLVRSMIFNDLVINVTRVDAALDERNQRPAFDRLLNHASLLLAGSFVLSAVLNFGLARFLIHSQPDTPEFNAELGRMTLWSWPVIALPSMAVMMFALWRLLKGVERLTDLTFDDIMHAPPEKKIAETSGTPPIDIKPDDIKPS